MTIQVPVAPPGANSNLIATLDCSDVSQGRDIKLLDVAHLWNWLAPQALILWRPKPVRHFESLLIGNDGICRLVTNNEMAERIGLFVGNQPQFARTS